jgi:hypothetical protein
MALNLAPHFRSVKAIDPSAKMISQGLQPAPPIAPIDYAVGNSERLDLVDINKGNKGVDLVVAGRCPGDLLQLFYENSKPVCLGRGCPSCSNVS